MKMKSNLSQMIPYKPGVLKEGALKLSSNENRLGPSPKAIEAILHGINNVNIYPDGTCRILREALAEKLGYKRENIIVGNGSDELMTLIAATYVSHGDNAITAVSTFSEYTFATILFSGEIQKAEMTEGTFDPAKILALINSNTKIIYFCNPNNPTGTYINHNDLDDMLKKIPHDILFVLDEAYADYSDALDFPDSKQLLEKYPNLMILRTFSKIYGLAGLRVGYGIAREEVLEEILVTKQPFNVNTPAQIGATAALSDDDFYRRSREMNSIGKRFIYDELDRLELKYYESQANFVCLYIGMDSKVLFQQMMDQGITIRPLTSFGLEQWIRVTVGTEEDNRLFIRILENTLK
ncbi:MAG: histidinol-phosphate transaminase [Spirochaetaceae bacterium]|nr:histidinol-phosphate transaminase [Spirochaetaceae bacterium]